jgi:trehalose-6-phosphate synthase
LLDALCACDVIDFHTQGYRDSYLQCVTELDRAVGDVNGWFSEGD